MTRSTDEWLMSLSCHRGTFSRAETAQERTSRASPHTFSDSTGLRLWGMAEDPICLSVKGSSASRTSVRCRWRTSTANFSTELASTARTLKKKAWRSRWMTWLETGSGVSPAALHTYSSTSGGTCANVPTAPETMPQRTSSAACSSRARFRRISSCHRASLRPKVMGSACTPWVRPIMGVSL